MSFQFLVIAQISAIACFTAYFYLNKRSALSNNLHKLKLLTEIFSCIGALSVFVLSIVFAIFWDLPNQ